MSTSGTYNFNNSLGDSVLYAFNLIQIRPTEITQEHMQSARMAANLMAATWSTDTPNLWKVELVQVPIVAGQATYSYDPSVVVILDVYASIANGDGTYTDRILLPVGRSEYASYPEKSEIAPANVYWADRTLNPTITLWPVPDGSQAYLNYYCVQQMQDSVYGASTIDVPYYYLEAFALGLAARLAMIWAPEKAVMLKAAYDEIYEKANSQNTENAAVSIFPGLSSYFRN